MPHRLFNSFQLHFTLSCSQSTNVRRLAHSTAQQSWWLPVFLVAFFCFYANSGYTYINIIYTVISHVRTSKKVRFDLKCCNKEYAFAKNCVQCQGVCSSCLAASDRCSPSLSWCAILMSACFAASYGGSTAN